jgi:hypothetical protein
MDAELHECHNPKCGRPFTPSEDGPTFHCTTECAKRCLADRLGVVSQLVEGDSDQ